MARTFGRPVAELQVRMALLNRFTPLDTPDTVAVASLRLGSGTGVLSRPGATKPLWQLTYRQEISTQDQ